jgi:hypothetical protein
MDIFRNRKKKAIKEKLDKYFRWWINRLGLRWWKIDLRWANKKSESAFMDNNDGTFAMMECWADWKYMKADITVNLYELAKRNDSDEELEEMVVHELQHILLNEMREKGIEHEERVAMTLQRAFLWVRDLRDEED